MFMGWTYACRYKYYCEYYKNTKWITPSDTLYNKMSLIWFVYSTVHVLREGASDRVVGSDQLSAYTLDVAWSSDEAAGRKSKCMDNECSHNISLLLHNVTLKCKHGFRPHLGQGSGPTWGNFALKFCLDLWKVQTNIQCTCTPCNVQSVNSATLLRGLRP